MSATPAQVAVAMSGILDHRAGQPCKRQDVQVEQRRPKPVALYPQCTRHGGRWDTEHDVCPHAVKVADAIAGA